jgi:hypothetical protein
MKEAWTSMKQYWKRARFGAAGVIVAAVAIFAVACGGDDDDDDDAVPTSPPAATQPAAVPTEVAEGGGDGSGDQSLGETPGWAAGSEGTVFYTRDFFCNSEPCVVGEAGTNPSDVIDPVPSVWVLVPLFAETEGLTFHCNTEGTCPTHPTELDVSAIGLGDVIPLPPHNHIIDPGEPGFSAAGETPWKVVVVGINSREAWDMLEDGKSLETLRDVQAMGETAATADIPTNLILFFGVR